MLQLKLKITRFYTFQHTVAEAAAVVQLLVNRNSKVQPVPMRKLRDRNGHKYLCAGKWVVSS